MVDLRKDSPTDRGNRTHLANKQARRDRDDVIVRRVRQSEGSTTIDYVKPLPCLVVEYAV